MGSSLTPADLDSLKRENGTFNWRKLMRLQRGGNWDPKKHDPCDLLKYGDLDNEEFWNGEFGCELRLAHPTAKEKADKQKRDALRCPYCDKASFARHKYLTEHIKAHTNKRLFHCPTCDKPFSQRGNLTQHIRTHSNERPYRCHLCDKVFAQDRHLTEHIKVHTNKGLFHCPTCNKPFNRLGNLTQHIKTHTNERPYHCPDCKKPFSQKGSIRRHIETFQKKCIQRAKPSSVIAITAS